MSLYQYWVVKRVGNSNSSCEGVSYYCLVRNYPFVTHTDERFSYAELCIGKCDFVYFSCATNLQALSRSNATALLSHSALHQLSASQAHGNPVNRYSALQQIMAYQHVQDTLPHNIQPS